MRLPAHTNYRLEARAFITAMECPATCGETKMELTMKQLLASPSLQLVTYPASATAQSAEFASADCVTGLNEIGQISVSNISGDPQDVEHIVALKADEQGASWYRIITMYEDQQPDNWRVQAILYA